MREHLETALEAVAFSFLIAVIMTIGTIGQAVWS
jgi:hypothetical protein